jgi:bifunctional DNA-binding transcriptional regulator/antitoxin component of YhaV-PrlF toxin-antitoxin module
MREGVEDPGREGEEWSPTFTARVEKKYRIWISRIVRELMDVKEGDYVEVKIRVVKRSGILRR